MIEKNVGNIKDIDTRQTFEHIFREAFGLPLQLSAAPTATAPLLKANEWGFYSGKLYYRIQNIIYEVTPSSTITVS
jgi:hypothetical protein